MRQDYVCSPCKGNHGESVAANHEQTNSCLKLAFC
ncbi:hypothetical protein BN2475_950013 [Paraburkholderia ribeironis]|uniref:Uncharacterized protein n=1 Tax=Paraburkholderia ribeironis TaxID=1247936 RepID=A0A1N7SLA5_9BURK|nr:hypothetical protein BN2475_950013 [Paraburkholderia ribeironis]